ncbi:hypothetical protein KIPB_004178 [Kipferlia bialata]|uniref:Uncharacterized protein n=1 Tax=Kipferlia bialata TaxID=797122 RepID=A0A9K3CVL6_9EUKA|nr:hypothetical protein KIPB_004178 [Kipferlia bialata]|eukprot:g4178.t1
MANAPSAGSVDGTPPDADGGDGPRMTREQYEAATAEYGARVNQGRELFPHELLEYFNLNSLGGIGGLGTALSGANTDTEGRHTQMAQRLRESLAQSSAASPFGGMPHLHMPVPMTQGVGEAPPPAPQSPYADSAPSPMAPMSMAPMATRDTRPSAAPAMAHDPYMSIDGAGTLPPGPACPLDAGQGMGTHPQTADGHPDPLASLDMADMGMGMGMGVSGAGEARARASALGGDYYDRDRDDRDRDRDDGDASLSVSDMALGYVGDMTMDYVLASVSQVLAGDNMSVESLLSRDIISRELAQLNKTHTHAHAHAHADMADTLAPLGLADVSHPHMHARAAYPYPDVSHQEQGGERGLERGLGGRGDTLSMHHYDTQHDTQYEYPATGRDGQKGEWERERERDHERYRQKQLILRQQRRQRERERERERERGLVEGSLALSPLGQQGHRIPTGYEGTYTEGEYAERERGVAGDDGYQGYPPTQPDPHGIDRDMPTAQGGNYAHTQPLPQSAQPMPNGHVTHSQGGQGVAPPPLLHFATLQAMQAGDPCAQPSSCSGPQGVYMQQDGPDHPMASMGQGRGSHTLYGQGPLPPPLSVPPVCSHNSHTHPYRHTPRHPSPPSALPTSGAHYPYVGMGGGVGMHRRPGCMSLRQVSEGRERERERENERQREANDLFRHLRYTPGTLPLPVPVPVALGGERETDSEGESDAVTVDRQRVLRERRISIRSARRGRGKSMSVRARQWLRRVAREVGGGSGGYRGTDGGRGSGRGSGPVSGLTPNTHTDTHTDTHTGPAPSLGIGSRLGAPSSVQRSVLQDLRDSIPDIHRCLTESNRHMHGHGHAQTHTHTHTATATATDSDVTRFLLSCAFNKSPVTPHALALPAVLSRHTPGQAGPASTPGGECPLPCLVSALRQVSAALALSEVQRRQQRNRDRVHRVKALCRTEASASHRLDRDLATVSKALTNRKRLRERLGRVVRDASSLSSRLAVLRGGVCERETLGGRESARERAQMQALEAEVHAVQGVSQGQRHRIDSLHREEEGGAHQLRVLQARVTSLKSALSASEASVQTVQGQLEEVLAEQSSLSKALTCLRQDHQAQAERADQRESMRLADRLSRAKAHLLGVRQTLDARVARAKAALSDARAASALRVQTLHSSIAMEEARCAQALATLVDLRQAAVLMSVSPADVYPGTGVFGQVFGVSSPESPLCHHTHTPYPSAYTGTDVYGMDVYGDVMSEDRGVELGAAHGDLYQSQAPLLTRDPVHPYMYTSMSRQGVSKCSPGETEADPDPSPPSTPMPSHSTDQFAPITHWPFQ